MGEAIAMIDGVVPDHVPSDRVIPFDFRRDIGAADNPWDVAESMNDRPDIFWSPEVGGYWVATRAAVIEEVFRRHDIFSSRNVMIPPLMSSGVQMVNTEDPPNHARFRTILTGAMFSPRALAGIEEQARAITIKLIEGFAPYGACEFVSAFTRPMPVDVFMSMFGMATDQRMAFVPWVEQFFRAQNREQLWEARDAIFGLVDGWLDEQIADPSKREGHIMQAMFDAKVDGRGVTKQEMTALSLLLINAALDTTTAQMTHQMRFLATHPAHRDLLIARPDLIPNAVESMLRRFGMINTGRLVKDDMEFHGVQMKAGDMVLCSTAIAGLDRAAHPEPRALDFEGKREKHWAFGSGIHLCPGAYLARMELRILIEEALPRMPGLRLAAGASSKAVSGITISLPTLPLEWDAHAD